MSVFARYLIKLNTRYVKRTGDAHFMPFLHTEGGRFMPSEIEELKENFIGAFESLYGDFSFYMKSKRFSLLDAANAGIRPVKN